MHISKSMHFKKKSNKTKLSQNCLFSKHIIYSKKTTCGRKPETINALQYLKNIYTYFFQPGCGQYWSCFINGGVYRFSLFLAGEKLTARSAAGQKAKKDLKLNGLIPFSQGQSTDKWTFLSNQRLKAMLSKSEKQTRPADTCGCYRNFDSFYENGKKWT